MLDIQSQWSRASLIAEAIKLLQASNIVDARRNVEWMLCELLICDRATLYAYPEAVFPVNLQKRFHDTYLVESQVLRILDGLGPDLGPALSDDLQFNIDNSLAFLVEHLDACEIRILLELYADQYEAKHDADIG